MEILIYFIGVILSFLLGRHIYRMACIKENMTYDYTLAITNIILSFASLIAVIAWIIIYIIIRLINIKQNKKSPPRWM